MHHWNKRNERDIKRSAETPWPCWPYTIYARGALFYFCLMCCECTHEQSNSFRTDHQPTGRETGRLIYFLITLAVLLFFSFVEISALYFPGSLLFHIQLFHELLFVDIPVTVLGYGLGCRCVCDALRTFTTTRSMIPFLLFISLP